ncbi:winged helix-turn helix family protein [Burkholderia pseudomallei 576]|nr:winged helix-turn helix family protein [Burkholderia pseudomallei 576]EEC33878.1 hypothetical protein BUC_4503 [Burkholderia pseudomallei 576]KGD27260.1 winged helix-turn helix family protein [Burkholderia pseudomallei]
MRCELRLAEVEKLTLEQLALNHRHRDIRTRATGLVLLSSGLTAPKVAARLGVTVQSPYDWVMAWRERGVVGLLTGHGGGRLRALPDTMVAAAIQIATTESLALARIAQCLEATVNEPLPCRIETLGMALKREGRSFKRNRYALKKKRDEEAFAMKQTTLAKLQQAARQDAVRLLYLDEAGFCGSPPVQRSWSSRGLPHEIEPNHHCRRSVIGALDFGSNTLRHAAHAGTIKGSHIKASSMTCSPPVTAGRP